MGKKTLYILSDTNLNTCKTIYSMLNDTSIITIITSPSSNNSPSSSSSSSSSSNSNNSLLENRNWTCMLCLTRHKPDDKFCSICGASPTSSSSSSAVQHNHQTWYCDCNQTWKCRFINGSLKTTCTRCLAIKQQQQQNESLCFNETKQSELMTPLKPFEDFNKKFSTKTFTPAPLMPSTPVKPVDFHRKFF